MLYRILADVVVVVHWLLGGYFARQHPWLALFHVPLALWVGAAFVLGWTCPLTPLENRLRKAAGERGYQGNFVDHYLGMNLPEDTASPLRDKRKREVVMGIGFCLFAVAPHMANLGAYWDLLCPPGP